MNTNIKTAKIDTKISYYVTRRPHVVKELVLFFIITFAIMFGLGGLGMAFRSQIEKIFGPISNNNLFVMILIYAPTIAGLTMKLFLRNGAVSLLYLKEACFSPSLSGW
jgi:hypothetical protein